MATKYVKGDAIIYGMILAVLALLIACGTTAPPTPEPTAATASQPTATPSAQATTAPQPTAAPVPTTAPPPQETNRSLPRTRRLQ
jgi:hypothetical protein